MKKLFTVLAAFFATIAISSNVSAASVDLSRYPSETLSEAFAAESITYDFAASNYSDTGDKPTIYVFRKAGCTNCINFYNYIKNTLLPAYGSKFKVISYELSDATTVNFDLLTQFTDFFNQTPANGIYSTPIVIVGDTISLGSITSARQQEIENLIQSGTTYDVIDELNAGITNINDSMKTVFTDITSNITLTTSTPYYRTHSLSTSPTDASALKLDQYEYISAYDLNLMNGATVIPLSDTELTIQIPISSTYNTYKVAYIERGSISEVLDATYSNGFITFTTSHLSEYAIYGTTKAPTPTPTPTPDKTESLTPSSTETLTSTDTAKSTTKKTIPLAPNTAAPISEYASTSSITPSTSNNTQNAYNNFNSYLSTFNRRNNTTGIILQAFISLIIVIATTATLNLFHEKHNK